MKSKLYRLAGRLFAKLLNLESIAKDATVLCVQEEQVVYWRFSHLVGLALLLKMPVIVWVLAGGFMYAPPVTMVKAFTWILLQI